MTDSAPLPAASRSPVSGGSEFERVRAALPADPQLVWADPHVSLLDYPDAVAELLGGEFSAFDELDDQCRDDGAFDVVRSAAFQAGVDVSDLDPDEVSELLSIVFDRDASVSLVEQLAARSRDLVVGLVLDIPASSLGSASVVADVAAMLDVDPADPAVATFAASATQVSVLARLRAVDAVRLAGAVPTDLVTVTVTHVGDFNPGWGEGWLDLLAVPGSVMVSVEEFREAVWLDGVPRRSGTWYELCGGFVSEPIKSVTFELVEGLKDERADLFVALLRDGWSTRSAYHAALAEAALAERDRPAPQVSRPPRSASVPDRGR